MFGENVGESEKPEPHKGFSLHGYHNILRHTSPRYKVLVYHNSVTNKKKKHNEK